MRTARRVRSAATRTGVAATVIAAAVACAGPAVRQANFPPEPRGHVLLGAEISYRDLANPRLMDVVDRYFSSITPNAEFKWNQVEAHKGVITLGPAEALVRAADSAGLAVRASNLVWDQPGQHPAYLDADLASGGSAAVAADMKQHIAAEMTPFAPGGQYAGDVSSWDVVNEPLVPGNGTALETGQVFDKALGTPAYIAAAFNDAHAVDPTANLCINEQGVTGMSPRSTAFYDLVASLLHSGVPITCVGFETHVSAADVLFRNDSERDIAANFARFAKLSTAGGKPLDLQITELDVRLPFNGVTPVGERALQLQAQAYAAVATGCRSVPNCTSITTWGVDDGESWVPSHFHDCPLPTALRVFGGTVCGDALMFNRDYQPKPAYTAVRQVLSS